MYLTHSQAERYLEQLLDGPLPAAERKSLDAHLRICATCRAYAEQSAQFHAQLSQSLPTLWPRRQASRAQLAQTISRVEAQQGRRRRWFASAAHSLLRLVLLLAIATAAFWYFERQGAAPEDAAFSDPDIPSAEMADQVVAVRFDLDFNGLPGGEIEFYVPVCDGVEYVPSASALFHKLNLGQPLPECDLQPTDTILLAPGDTHELLLVYRNPSASAVRFSFEPTSHTNFSQPFLQALCNDAAAATPATSCATYEAPPRGIWAKFLAVKASPATPPGAHVHVTARVQWTRDAQ